MNQTQNETDRARFEILRAQMENEYNTFFYHHREINDFFMPRRGRFFVTDVDKGNRRSQKIVDPTGTMAAETLCSGMMAYNTNPASEWWQFVAANPSLRDNQRVKQWCDDVRQILNLILLQSTFYDSALIAYKDLCLFGTAAVSIEEDFEHCIFTRVFPIGSYMIGNDNKLRVRVFFRKFMMTVRQVVEEFGNVDPATGAVDWTNISDMVKGLWDKKSFEQWVEVCHVIAPNDAFDGKRKLSKFKKFRSTYYERGSSAGAGAPGSMPAPGGISGKFLRDEGFDYFPVLAPRWEVTGEDIYGTNCPGVVSLGDVKQLQVMERRKLQAVEKGVNPPLVGPSSLRNQRVSLQPGDLTFVDNEAANAVLRPLHEVKWDINPIEETEEKIRERIKEAFYVPIIQTFIDDAERRQPITAAEVAEKKSEKLVALGNVVWRIQREFLDPAISTVFRIAMKQGRLPPPPPELYNAGALKVEYTSILAQAQKALNLAGIDRFTGYVNGISTAHPDHPEFLDSVDWDEAIAEYADKTGIPPHLIKPPEVVAQIRAQRQQQQEAAQKAQMAEQAANSANKLGNASTQGGTALGDLIAQAKGGAADQVPSFAGAA